MALAVLTSCHSSANHPTENQQPAGLQPEAARPQATEMSASMATGSAIAPAAVPSERVARDSSALPSMSDFTSAFALESDLALSAENSVENSTETVAGKSQTVAGRGLPASGAARGQDLAPGEYCYHKATASNWLSIRMVLTGDLQLSGETTGTVTHPTKGSTRYQQTLAGELAGSQAVVDVTTYLGDITQHRQEGWTIDTRQLDMGRVLIEAVPCLEVTADFQPLQ